jgi:hypothetical protein
MEKTTARVRENPGLRFQRFRDDETGRGTRTMADAVAYSP